VSLELVDRVGQRGRQRRAQFGMVDPAATR
jgi:hypothetical protein